jgi:hypothetical protein
MIILLAGQACRQRVDLEKEKDALMMLHEQQRQAHLSKNVSLLLGDNLTDYVEVNRGVIGRPKNSESKKRFQSYFNSVDFVSWDDVTPPVFTFSDDGTMATSVVDKVVITRSTSQPAQVDTAYYAWLAVFKKVDGKWKMHRMGSTNK